MKQHKFKPKKMGFSCLHCGSWVANQKKYSGTFYRNHCPFCLWSKHLGQGRTAVACGGAMEPIGLTFKQEGWDKNGNPRQGELMLINRCQECRALTINRLAGDDEPQTVFGLYQDSLKLGQEDRDLIKENKIRLLNEEDLQEVRDQLFGKG